MNRPPGAPLHLLLLVTGEAIPSVAEGFGSFAHLFRQGLEAAGRPFQLTAFDITERAPGDPHPNTEGIDGVIVTGSPAMVGDDLPWMRYGEDLLRALVGEGTPLLGVCFGHQLLAQAFESDVGRSPRGYGVGTVPFTPLPPDALSTALPDAPPGPFPVNVSHVDVVRVPGPRLEILGQTPHDPCAMYRIGARALAVQFHPEFSGAVTRAYIRSRMERIAADHGPDAPASRLASVRDTPESQALLGAFMALCDSVRAGAYAPRVRTYTSHP